jgi:seryl-tRNA synthetase
MGHGDERSYADGREVVEVMKAQESHHETASTARAKREEPSEMLKVTPGEKQNGDVSRQHQNREDLEKAYNEAKVSEAQLADSEARLQTIIDMVPSFLWTSLPDGSKEYLNKRRINAPLSFFLM